MAFMTGHPRLHGLWNCVIDDVRDRIIAMALDHADLTPRELVVKFTATESYFVPEASVYRLLKAHDPITSPAYDTFIRFSPAFVRMNVIKVQPIPIGDAIHSQCPSLSVAAYMVLTIYSLGRVSGIHAVGR